MKRAGAWPVAFAAGFLVIVLWGASASAEVFLDLYGGATMFSDPDFTVTREGQGRETERGSADTDFTVGGRGGYWFDGQGLRWLGVAVDISYFEPEYSGESGNGSIASVKVLTVPITPLVMFRLPLMTSPQHPNGQLQLYTGAGPGFFVRETTVRFRSEGGESSKSGVSVGADVRAGVAWEFTPNWTVFTEYRFTYYAIDSDGQVQGQNVNLKADYSAHHLLFGVGYRFR